MEAARHPFPVSSTAPHYRRIKSESQDFSKRGDRTSRGLGRKSRLGEIAYSMASGTLTSSVALPCRGLSEREVEIFLDAVVAMAEPVETHFLWRPQLRDAGDEMVLEAAVNGRADLLVTFNVRDFGDVPSRFGIELMIPRDALERIRQ
jgi:PIN domain-containing protein